MNHIFYQTKTKYSNSGDALINHALIAVLRNYGEVHANCGSDVPESFINRLGIRPEERFECNNELSFIWKIIICAIESKRKNDKVFVFSGPGDLYGGGAKLVLRNFASGLVFPLLRILNVQIIRIGRSMGPVSYAMALSEKIRSIFLSGYYLRDSLSFKRCKELGIKNIARCPDLSWAYDSDHPRVINDTNAVMVNLRNSIYDDVDGSFIEATLHKCEEILKALNNAMDGNMKIYVAYQIDEDEVFSKVVYERLKEVYETEYIDHRMQLNEFEKYYGQVDYHISNRMHSLLAGYKYGSLPIAIIDTQNHSKISATFEDCEQNNLVFDIYSVTNPNDVRKMIQKRNEFMYALWDCEEKREREIQEIVLRTVNR